MYSCRVESEARGWLIRRRLPLVYVDQDPVPGVSTVNVDGSSGVVADPLAATRGHPQRERLRGWLDASRPAAVTPVVVHVADNSFAAVQRAAKELLDAPDRPTAVLCFSDVLAFGVVEAAAELGLAVPEDLSVVGFDDSPAASWWTPRLTTVRQDVGAKGRAAARALITAIDRARGEGKSRVRHLVLPTELVVRQSTGAPVVERRRRRP